MKKQFFILFAFISVLALSQVPQRFNKVIVTGDITSPKFIKTGSNADSVLLGNGSARAISTVKTDTVSLSNRINAKAAGSGTANGTNTGDETLTSIKTKLGAATSVSDGYLKYQDFALLHTPTTVTAANGLSISGQNISLQNASLTQSGALTFNDWNTFNSKEPAITKNSGFNKNFGTTTGTILEGRTFGTAANSAVGDFQPIENQRLSTANSPSFNKMTSTVATGTEPLTVNSTTMVGNLNADLLDGQHASAFQPIITGIRTNNIPKWNGTSFANSSMSDDGSIAYTTRPSGTTADFTLNQTGIKGWHLQNIATTGEFRIFDGIVNALRLAPATGAATFIYTVNATSFYGNGSNLTGVQLPITLTTNGTSGAATFSGNVLNVPNYASTGTGGEFTSNYTNISNTTLSTSTLAAYTNINGIINASVFGAVTSTASGKCTFRLSVPTVIRSGRCAVVSGVESGKTTSANIFIEGTGSTYVDISFIASTASSILEFKVITMGY